jgi:hypothetical protein
MWSSDDPPPRPPQPERAEPRPCKVCKRPIQGGQLYVVAGPRHVICKPPKRLDVARMRKAAVAVSRHSKT